MKNPFAFMAWLFANSKMMLLSVISTAEEKNTINSDAVEAPSTYLSGIFLKKILLKHL